MKDHQAVVYIGRLEVEKGIQTLIGALASLKRSDVKLYLVGKGEYEPELRSMAVEEGIADRVVFVGFVGKEEVARYYRLADVFVHPALWPEPFPRTLLEALAFDVPLIVSDRGASSNVLGKAGTTFPAGDTAQLAVCLVRCSAARRGGRRWFGSAIRYWKSTRRKGSWARSSSCTAAPCPGERHYLGLAGFSHPLSAMDFENVNTHYRMSRRGQEGDYHRRYEAEVAAFSDGAALPQGVRCHRGREEVAGPVLLRRHIPDKL